MPAFPEYAADGARNAPVAYDVSGRGINLPCAFTLTEEQIEHYSGGTKTILGL